MMIEVSIFNSNSAVKYLFVESSAKIFDNPEDVEVLRHCCIVYSGNDIQLAQGYAWPNGYGRSIRAIILGLPYKSACRINGTYDEFTTSMFALPQPDKYYLNARETAIARLNKPQE